MPGTPAIFECVPNVSEGRDLGLVAAGAAAITAAGVTLARTESDAAHHRSVYTFFGGATAIRAAALGLARVTTAGIDLREHRGAHPRIGALDVVPIVAFGSATPEDARALARDVASDLWHELAIPSFFYAASAAGGRTLANVRSGGFERLAAETGGAAFDTGERLHPTAGAVAVGVREPLVAFNVVLASRDLALARAIARTIRERDGGLRTLRALGIDLGTEVQVSCNITDVAATPLHRVTGTIRALAADAGVAIARTELIGLVPRAALAAVVASEVRKMRAQ